MPARRLMLAAIIAVTIPSVASLRAGPPASPPSAAGAVDPVAPRDTAHYNLPRTALAIEGYDPVAYFPEGGGSPAPGKPEHEFTFRGVRYRFASAGHLALFRSNPLRYEPAYGGWCASAMADGGRKVEINPKAFEVSEGRLFLFYKTIFQDARGYWDKDAAANAKAADAHWMKLTGEAARNEAPKAAEATGAE